MEKYIVFTGYATYHPESHIRTAPRFATLKEARAYARQYRRSAIYRIDESHGFPILEREMKVIVC